jgi:hypothetical protein
MQWRKTVGSAMIETLQFTGSSHFVSRLKLCTKCKVRPLFCAPPTELCAQCGGFAEGETHIGISRKTGYRHLERYRVEGLMGLRARSHRPQHFPQRTDEAAVGLEPTCLPSGWHWASNWTDHGQRIPKTLLQVTPAPRSDFPPMRAERLLRQRSSRPIPPCPRRPSCRAQAGHPSRGQRNGRPPASSGAALW